MLKKEVELMEKFVPEKLFLINMVEELVIMIILTMGDQIYLGIQYHIIIKIQLTIQHNMV